MPATHILSVYRLRSTHELRYDNEKDPSDDFSAMKVNIVVKTLLNGSVSSSSFTARTNGTLVIAGQ